MLLIYLIKNYMEIIEINNELVMIKNFNIIKLLFLFILFIPLLSSKESSKINKNNLNGDINDNKKIIIKDVLFINGCNTEIVPHPFRYRVLHQMEQLNANFLESDTYFYLNFEPSIVRNYRVIIFFRCPWNEKVGEAIKLAKNLNKKVLFDIDDLVFDTKYTNVIPYVKALSPKEKESYDSGVILMGKTLKHCEGAITTTDALAKELRNYVSNVIINHNVASEEMWNLSQNALINKGNKIQNDSVIIGYFSGSITHNPDIEMIKQPLIKILREFKNVQLLLFGILDFPNFLEDFRSQVIIKNFGNWKELPKFISDVDINLAPIETNIFNAAKSENKWVEAAMVKVPTVASNFGAFKKVIQHNETGFLCSNMNEWYISLKSLILNPDLRKIIGEKAHKVCRERYNTINTGKKLSNFINSLSSRHIGFFIPSLHISGGIYVILKHACILKDEGWDIDLIIPKGKSDLFEFEGHLFNCLSLESNILEAQYDIIVATFYSTLYSVLNYYKTKRYLYLVQNYETDFYPYGTNFRFIAEKTYSAPNIVEYITISKWCKQWLWKKYKKKSKYIQNGIDFQNFTSHKRELKGKKIRILIEGDCTCHYKNVDESFKITEKLDKDKFEVWYLSYNYIVKDWYRLDKFISDFPHEKINEIYNQCDILLKSSVLESFSYPPIEMMATGGYCIVAPNGGNKEYLKNEENCLFYKLGDISSAVNSIKRLISDEKLQNNLYKNGLLTAKKRDWKNIKNQIISVYNT